MRIKTSRLELISCDQDLLRILIFDPKRLKQMMNITIPQQFTEYGLAPLHYAMEKLKSPEESDWWTYLPVLIDKRLCIGTCGFKGKPDLDGIVEIRYEVIQEMRNNGYAKELANGLIQWAIQSPLVNIVRAHTLPNENASTHVLRSCNMKFVDAAYDPEEGKVWRWEIHK